MNKGGNLPWSFVRPPSLLAPYGSMRICSSLAPRWPPKSRRHLATFIHYRLLTSAAACAAHPQESDDDGAQGGQRGGVPEVAGDGGCREEQVREHPNHQRMAIWAGRLTRCLLIRQGVANIRIKRAVAA